MYDRVAMFGFFFSSRRRHTRWPRDWSSDVCSSDLAVLNWPRRRQWLSRGANRYARVALGLPVADATAGFRVYPARSEERRVGKECGGRRETDQENRERRRRREEGSGTRSRALCEAG